jgi:putative transposon-encoded protein
MMSPTFSLEKNVLIPKEIAAIRDEIGLIDAHRTAHMEGSRIRQLDSSCKYCKPYAEKAEEKKVPVVKDQAMATRGSLSTVNDLERTVEVSGKKGHIIVPRSWAGKKVRVTLI